MKALKFILEYVWELIRDGWSIAGFIIAALPQITFFSGVDLAPHQNILEDNRISLLFLAILIAGFRAWFKIRKKIENEVDYEIEYQVLPLISAGEMLKAENSYGELVANNKKTSMYADFTGSHNPHAQKISECEGYINELKLFHQKSADFCRIIFLIKNIGIKSDQSIQCKLIDAEANPRIISDKSLLADLNSPPQMPNQGFYTPFFSPARHAGSDAMPYRQEIAPFCYSLRELHVGDATEIFWADEGIIVEAGEPFDLVFEIKSRYLKRPLIKKIRVSGIQNVIGADLHSLRRHNTKPEKPAP